MRLMTMFVKSFTNMWRLKECSERERKWRQSFINMLVQLTGQTRAVSKQHTRLGKERGKQHDQHQYCN